MEPRFADIPDFPDYQVSDDGKVWSYKTGKGAKGNTGRRELVGKASPPHRVHYLVTMSVLKGVKTTKYIHSLVMTAFGPSPLEGQTQIDHIDRNPTNNAITNLRWVTPHENLMNRAISEGANLYIRELKHKTRTSFAVQIPKHITKDKPLSLGSYPTIDEAKQVRNAYLLDGTMPQRELPTGIGRTQCRGVDYFRLCDKGKYVSQHRTLEEALAAREALLRS